MRQEKRFDIPPPPDWGMLRRSRCVQIFFLYKTFQNFETRSFLVICQELGVGWGIANAPTKFLRASLRSKPMFYLSILYCMCRTSRGGKKMSSNALCRSTVVALTSATKPFFQLRVVMAEGNPAIKLARASVLIWW